MTSLRNLPPERRASLPVALLLFLAFSLLSDPGLRQLPSFTLKDQFGNAHDCHFPAKTVRILTLADKKGAAEVLVWVRHLKRRYGHRITIEGIANVTGVPAPLRPMVRERFKKDFPHPVMLDWSGAAVEMLKPRKNLANVYAVDRQGLLLLSMAGPPTEANLAALFAAIDKALAAP